MSSDFGERPVKAPPIGWESSTRNIPRIRMDRGGGVGKKTFWLRARSSTFSTLTSSVSQHCTRHLNSACHPRKIGRVRNPCSKAQCRSVFVFSITDGTAKLFGRYHGVLESTLRKEQHVRSEDLREELSQPTEIKDVLKAAVTFDQVVITSNLEFSSTCRKKHH